MTGQGIAELAEDFALFDNWEDRYRYLIDLGDRVPPLDPALKTDENLVQGCTSRVWLVAAVREGVFHFQADSDSKIVKGLIYLLLAAYQDRPVSDFHKIDVTGAFERIGLHQHLSPNRRNGFFAIVKRIGELAAG